MELGAKHQQGLCERADLGSSCWRKFGLISALMGMSSNTKNHGGCGCVRDAAHGSAREVLEVAGNIRTNLPSPSQKKQCDFSGLLVVSVLPEGRLISGSHILRVDLI